MQVLHFSDCALVRVALLQHEKHYLSHPVGTTPSLCIQEYLQVKLTSVTVWLIYTLYAEIFVV